MIREEDYHFELLNKNFSTIGELASAELSGSLSGDYSSELGWSGSLKYVGSSVSRLDWYNYYVKPVLTVKTEAGATQHPLGVYVALPDEIQVDKSTPTTSLSLYPLTFILKSDAVSEVFMAAKGSNVGEVISSLIMSTGLNRLPIKIDSEFTEDLFWDAGTNKLKIINEILSSIGFTNIYCDSVGAFVAMQKSTITTYPTQYSFISGDKHLTAYKMSIDVAIPNKIICVSSATSGNPPFIATATNEDPQSIFSYQSRGIWVTRVYTGIEANTQKVLQDIANSYLSTVTGEIVYSYSVLAGVLDLNDLVETPDGKSIVTGASLTMKPGELMTVEATVL